MEACATSWDRYLLVEGWPGTGRLGWLPCISTYCTAPLLPSNPYAYTQNQPALQHTAASLKINSPSCAACDGPSPPCSGSPSSNNPPAVTFSREWAFDTPRACPFLCSGHEFHRPYPGRGSSTRSCALARAHQPTTPKPPATTSAAAITVSFTTSLHLRNGAHAPLATNLIAIRSSYLPTGCPLRFRFSALSCAKPR